MTRFMMMELSERQLESVTGGNGLTSRSQAPVVSVGGGGGSSCGCSVGPITINGNGNNSIIILQNVFLVNSILDINVFQDM